MYIPTIKQEDSTMVHIKTEPGLTTTPNTILEQQFTNHIRKERILEALKCSRMPADFKFAQADLEQTAEMINALVGKEDSRPTREPRMDQLFQMKLEVLEKWELTKRSAIEKLAEEIEELQAIEERIEKRRQELCNSGRRMNEQIFKRFCDGGQIRKSSTPKTQRNPKRTKLSSSQEGRNSGTITKPIVFQSDDNTSERVVIGPNGTTVSRDALNLINWNLSGAAVTRKILMEVFDRETLAFHTLSGKPSPAFMDCDKPLKNRLDPRKVEDIIHIITTNLPMTPKDVRSAITTKCADENKMFRQREKKRLSLLQTSRKRVSL